MLSKENCQFLEGDYVPESQQGCFFPVWFEQFYEKSLKNKTKRQQQTPKQSKQTKNQNPGPDNLV